jgi:HAD superfamily hydrolase (TIGR01549 family)
MPQEYRYIFFDVGSTLLFANRERMLAPLYERGIRPEELRLRTLEAEVKNEFDARMEHGDRPDHGFWDMFYQRLFEELDLKDELLRQQVIANTRNSFNWDQIRPGTREILEQIGKKYPLAVISNADGRIEQLLKSCGIADCFRTITDSGIVGHEKPHPVIFETALASMAARAEDSLYVGDVYAVDYRGATGAGMDAILFDVCGAYREKGLPRVETLSELVTLLD